MKVAETTPSAGEYQEMPSHRSKKVVLQVASLLTTSPAPCVTCSIPIWTGTTHTEATLVVHGR